MTQIISAAPANLEESRLPGKTPRLFVFHSSRGDKRADVHRSLIRVAKWGDVLLKVNVGQRAAKGRCDDEIVCVIPIVAALKMRVVVVGEKKCAGKFRTQRPQNHQLIVNV